MNISDELKDKAVSLGLCTEWTTGWGEPDKDELVQKYIKGIDFCIEHDYPSIEYIKQNFGDIAEKYGVYVDKRLDIIDPNILVLNGACIGKVGVGEYAVSTIYIRHNSDINLSVKKGGRAFIHIYDSAKINIVSDGKTFVYRHGGSVSATGDVVVRERRE